MLGGLQIDADEGQVVQFCRDHRIKRLWVFGSVLRRDFRPDSDVDVLVEFDDGAEVSLWALAGIQLELGDLLGRPVDLVERESLRNPFRRREILRTSRLIYAA